MINYTLFFLLFVELIAIKTRAGTLINNKY